MSTPESDNDEADIAYEQGSRMAWTAMLAMCLRNLGYDSSDGRRLAWIQEREHAVSALRSLCSDHGDNDWPDDLNLYDIIDKHLTAHLRRPR